MVNIQIAGMTTKGIIFLLYLLPISIHYTGWRTVVELWAHLQRGDNFIHRFLFGLLYLILIRYTYAWDIPACLPRLFEPRVFIVPSSSSWISLPSFPACLSFCLIVLCFCSIIPICGGKIFKHRISFIKSIQHYIYSASWSNVHTLRIHMQYNRTLIYFLLMNVWYFKVNMRSECITWNLRTEILNFVGLSSSKYM